MDDYLMDPEELQEIMERVDDHLPQLVGHETGNGSKEFLDQIS